MELAPGNKLPWVFFAKRSSKAHETAEGLIVMDGTPEETIMVPLSHESLKELSFAIEYAAQIWAMNRFFPVIKEYMRAVMKERQESIRRAIDAKKN